jgi:Na+/H+ antiporter NhaC
MSDDYFSEKRTTNLVFWATGQMAKGMLYAAVFVIGIGLLLWVIYGIGQMLPEESKQAPSPYGALVIESPVTLA